MKFLDDNFLLHSKAARELYHDYAANQPILDFHTHLSAADIANNRHFRDITEIWLDGDHYKWRLMRANGIAERYCTGNATSVEKLMAWAKTVPVTLRNPVYHWTHLELKRYFGFEGLFNEQNANDVWEKANALLADPELSVQGILKKFNVKVVCTTNDPCESLEDHALLNKSQSDFRVYPTFRPDQALQVDNPDEFNSWIERLGQAADVHIVSLVDFLEALNKRHEAFHGHGARMSDHGLPYCYATPCSETHAAEIFARARSGRAANSDEHEKFATFLMLFFGKLDADRGWTKQLHLGALRSVSSTHLRELGPDTGFDCIGDFPQAKALSGYLDLLERENALPKMILYNLNPADTYVFAAVAGAFEDGSTPGKIQLGSAWWFLDQKDGMESQLNTLSNTGLVSRFVGMVTDSRSFMSFPRHEYFRRILCDLLGNEMEKGDLPNDPAMIGESVRNICFGNARDFLGLELPPG